MAMAAREAMGKKQLQAVADRGYFSGPEIKACDEAGITPLVPKPMTSNAKAEGRFSKADFIYIAKDDEYQCPAGERAISFTTVEGRPDDPHVLDLVCPRCPLRSAMHDRQLRRIRAGSTRRCWKRCSDGLTASPRR